MPSEPSGVNTRRRTMLKFALLGSATFVLGKVLGPSINFFNQDLQLGSNDKETMFKNFRVVENGHELGFYDRLGNEILIIEKDPTQN